MDTQAASGATDPKNSTSTISKFKNTFFNSSNKQGSGSDPSNQKPATSSTEESREDILAQIHQDGSDSSSDDNSPDILAQELMRARKTKHGEQKPPTQAITTASSEPQKKEDLSADKQPEGLSESGSDDDDGEMDLAKIKQ